MPFDHIRDLLAQGLALPQIVEQTRCGTGCGLCQPYLQIVAATGRTRLPIMSPAQIAAVLAAAKTRTPTAPVAGSSSPSPDADAVRRAS